MILHGEGIYQVICDITSSTINYGINSRRSVCTSPHLGVFMPMPYIRLYSWWGSSVAKTLNDLWHLAKISVGQRRLKVLQSSGCRCIHLPHLQDLKSTLPLPTWDTPIIHFLLLCLNSLRFRHVAGSSKICLYASAHPCKPIEWDLCACHCASSKVLTTE